MSDPNSLLANMFSNVEGLSIPTSNNPADPILIPKQELSTYFIDRDPRYFNIVLNYLRSGVLEISETIDLCFLLEEAKYYQGILI